MDKEKKEKQDCTEQYAGIIILRKGRYEDKDVWYGTVGRQIISDGVFENREELIENLNKITLERVCKIMAGVFERAIAYKKN